MIKINTLLKKLKDYKDKDIIKINITWQTKLYYKLKT